MEMEQDLRQDGDLQTARLEARLSKIVRKQTGWLNAREAAPGCARPARCPRVVATLALPPHLPADDAALAENEVQCRLAFDAEIDEPRLPRYASFSSWISGSP